MTIEAGLQAIAVMGEGLTKAVNENTQNPGMFAVIERLIKALDRNTNTMLGQQGVVGKAVEVETAAPADAGDIPAKLKREKPAPEKKAEPKKAEAKPKIEYAAISQKALDLMAKHGKPALLAFLADRALSNLKQAHVDDYEEINAALDVEIAKDVEEELT